MFQKSEKWTFRCQITIKLGLYTDYAQSCINGSSLRRWAIYIIYFSPLEFVLIIGHCLINYFIWAIYSLFLAEADFSNQNYFQMLTFNFGAGGSGVKRLWSRRCRKKCVSKFICNFIIIMKTFCKFKWWNIAAALITKFISIYKCLKIQKNFL